MGDVVFLAGFTNRSIAYLQSMINANMKPDRIILFGNEHGNAPGQTTTKISNSTSDSTLFYPDFTISIIDSLRKVKWKYDILNVDNISDNKIFKTLIQTKPRLVIYSGYGSQIVPKKLLDIGSPFLHLHSGMLPEYRGSTTLYYSWLIEKTCAVSAIILDENIDTGRIVAKKIYPPPPKKIDPDYVYDPVIRADLLIDVLKEFSTKRKFLNLKDQNKAGKTYYVIHPILKHLARLQNNNK